MLDQRALGKFWKNPAALASAGILLVVGIAVIVGPLLLPVNYAEPGPLSFAPPSLQHPFGTDLNGRDLLYRVLAGGRISLLVGLVRRMRKPVHRSRLWSDSRLLRRKARQSYDADRRHPLLYSQTHLHSYLY